MAKSSYRPTIKSNAKQRRDRVAKIAGVIAFSVLGVAIHIIAYYYFGGNYEKPRQPVEGAGGWMTGGMAIASVIVAVDLSALGFAVHWLRGRFPRSRR